MMNKRTKKYVELNMGKNITILDESFWLDALATAGEMGFVQKRHVKCLGQEPGHAHEINGAGVAGLGIAMLVLGPPNNVQAAKDDPEYLTEGKEQYEELLNFLGKKQPGEGLTFKPAIQTIM